MIKCPRCNLEQDPSPQCEYCGLDFSEHRESARTAKAPAAKRMVLIGVILVLSVILLASYWFTANLNGNEPGQKSTLIEGSGSLAQSTKDEELHTVAKKLTGDLGIVGELTGGSTKGGIFAMVVFSIIGLGYLAYGKKSRQLLMILCGIGLMGYSYFLDGTLYIILIGLALSVLPFVLGRN